MTVEQLLREWPPGYGGVERVAHELANSWGGTVFSFDVQRQRSVGRDPIPLDYTRQYLPSIRLVGRLHMPLPCRTLWQLLRSRSHLHGHLPSPGVLFILFLARLMCPRRMVTAHWHCFLKQDLSVTGFFYASYQWLALRIVPHLSAVVTTSPSLAKELHRCGCVERRVFVLPCCLSLKQERLCMNLPVPETKQGAPLHILFIGRLDSYKRLDWLLRALTQLTTPWKLVVVGDGQKRQLFESLAYSLFPSASCVRFLGRLSESAKLDELVTADVLVLPSDSSNEAFGIVQLEAMSAGRIALAFDLPRSGMGWVGRLPGLSWSQSPDGLAEVLQLLSDQPILRSQLCLQARDRYRTLFSRAVWQQQLARFVDTVERGMVCNSAE